MKAKKVTTVDFVLQRRAFQESQLTFSFFDSHSAGRAYFGQHIEEQGWQINTRQGRLYLSCRLEENQMIIYDLLHEADTQFSWQKYTGVVESFARSRFAASVCWRLPDHPLFSEFFTQQGYQKVAAGFQKTLVYNTALVLGGGGAHGAYQIGVWQALQERGINFKWITGTSVGALNGALILMNDVEAAVDLWANISNAKVLQYPLAEAKAQTLREMMDQTHSLVVTALKTNGARTEPLAALLASVFDAEKFAQTTRQLLICTTRLPDFKETIYTFDPADTAENLQWLLASASFYPAMQAQQINGTYYIDGGYRNNLPIDVAIAQGATECITVDVQGPGVNKKINVSENIAQISLGSPWTMGSFLIFDAQRSLDNMTLGYLETLKTFGKYQGYWYTFEKDAQFQRPWRQCLRWLKQEHAYLYEEIKKTDFLKKLRKFYQGDIPVAEWGRILLECSAKTLHLPPTVIYEPATMTQGIAKKIAQEANGGTEAWSISEWLTFYKDRFYLLSEQNRFLFFYRTQALSTPALQQIRRRYPLLATLAAYSYYLLKGDRDGEIFL
ncbi:patatin-like phospholipase family protein [Enterococcus sp.]|uniref:patatin-like phospholipase family protein n=1 Tax=Enterococcus sp. TaxID=35783 RepID=UPI0028AA4740|nr:patatin-like phospholipase family protein [Enterococcus sp.]